MSKTDREVWAAGGVLWRPGSDGTPEIGLVHRPRYDDWTLPKGKAERGETLAVTAVRELHEETGHRVRLGRRLRTVSYRLSPNAVKYVAYWEARVVDGSFVPNDEVDELIWVSPDQAAELLTYRLDRKILVDFSAAPADTHTLLLVRHAKAGRRSRYRGDDRLRPLEKIGRAQADALVPLLRAFGAETLHAADRVRCEQTLQPMAEALDVPVHSEPLLSEEAYHAEADAAHRRVLDLAADTSTVRAVCSQGKVIPPLVQWWAERDGLALPKTRNRKGSMWVLSVSDGRLVAAHHLDTPFPPDQGRGAVAQ